MPKLTKFPLSKKNIVLLLIIYSVPIAILAYPNFSKQTITEIKILDKKTYLEKYEEKYKIKDPIQDQNIVKKNIIFSSETEINDFLETKKVSCDNLNKKEFIVDYCNIKYKKKNLSHIYFGKEKNTNKENILLFWEFKKTKNEPINNNIKELKTFPTEKKDINEDIIKNKNNLFIIKKELLYFQNKRIVAIYFDDDKDIQNPDKTIENDDIKKQIEILLKFYRNNDTKKIYFFSWDDENTGNSIKEIISRVGVNHQNHNKFKL